VPCRVHVSTIVLPQTLHPSARSRHRFRYIEFNFISLLPPIWAQGSWVSRVFSLSFMRSYCGYHRPLSMRRPAVFSRLSRMCLSWWLRRRFCCLCQIHRPPLPRRGRRSAPPQLASPRSSIPVPGAPASAAIPCGCSPCLLHLVFLEIAGWRYRRKRLAISRDLWIERLCSSRQKPLGSLSPPGRLSLLQYSLTFRVAIGGVPPASSRNNSDDTGQSQDCTKAMHEVLQLSSNLSRWRWCPATDLLHQ